MAQKVLLVEDERALARALGLKLANSGFEVDAVGSGADALEYLQNNKPDLILLDIVMPEMDGFGVLEKLKELGNTIPVIITSNLGQDEDMKRAAELGAASYIVKSHSSLSAIIDTVKQVLRA